MNKSNSNERLRVTSIPFTSSNLVIFCGVPLEKDCYKVNNCKYYVTVKVNPSLISVQPVCGQHWIVTGQRIIKQVESGDYLMQEHIYDSPEYIECSLPENGEQLIRFIANESDFKGIGESKARAIWQLLGRDFHSVLMEDRPEYRVRLRTVLSDNAIDSLYKGYSKYKNISYCNWMSIHKIPSSIQQRLLKYHGEQSIDAIKANPYVLIGFGMSFHDVDQLVSQSNFKDIISEDDQKRLSAAIEVAIRQEIDKGHTYTTQSSLRPHLIKLLKNDELVTQAFIAGHDQAQYIINNETGTYHPTAQLLMEKIVAKRLKKLANLNQLYDEVAKFAYLNAVGDLAYDLSVKQTEAVITCLDNGISCITGGAGTGKTTVLRTVLIAFHKMGFEIHPVALSGRAALRLHESIGFVTSTIAKFLSKAPIEVSEKQQNQLLVIDEASMVDLPTMYRLVNHIPPSVRILLTGDPDQLPPIGCGKVLADIVLSKAIANTQLDIVKRQDASTGIPEYSRLINQGIIPENISTGNIFFYEAEKDDIAKVCCNLYSESPENSRVIAPTKSLVNEINKRIQGKINGHGKRLEFSIDGEQLFLDLRLNDVILFTKNHYDKSIQNGSLGTLICIESINECYGDVLLDTGESIKITRTVLDCMELGYAITLHKAQGSQFPRIIIALQKCKIVDRSWLYTAITRAECDVYIVGGIEDLRDVIARSSNASNRNSYLYELLK